MNDISNDLVINCDQTALHLVPTGQWTMHHAGDKVVPIINFDDKRQITAVLAATMTRGVFATTADLRKKDEQMPS